MLDHTTSFELLLPTFTWMIIVIYKGWHGVVYGWFWTTSLDHRSFLWLSWSFLSFWYFQVPLQNHYSDYLQTVWGHKMWWVVTCFFIRWCCDHFMIFNICLPLSFLRKIALCDLSETTERIIFWLDGDIPLLFLYHLSSLGRVYVIFLYIVSMIFPLIKAGLLKHAYIFDAIRQVTLGL